jgi:hypothetical protein
MDYRFSPSEGKYQISGETILVDVLFTSLLLFYKLDLFML